MDRLLGTTSRTGTGRRPFLVGRRTRHRFHRKQSTILLPIGFGLGIIGWLWCIQILASFQDSPSVVLLAPRSTLVCSGWTLPSTPRRPPWRSSTHRHHERRQPCWTCHGDRPSSPIYEGAAARILPAGCRTRITSMNSGTSTQLFMAKSKPTVKWEVGDWVQILPKQNNNNIGNNNNNNTAWTTATSGAAIDETTPKGQIVAIRGGGWYSVRLVQQHGDTLPPETAEIVKCRGTQLQQWAMDIPDDRQNGTPNLQSSSISRTTTLPLIPSVMHEEDDYPLQSMEGYQHDDALAEAGSPPPIIRDLDAELSGLESSSLLESMQRQAAHHATYENWVVFTDLHCAPSTLDTCLQVLEIVHQTAVSFPHGKCGVLFLGDFWHHRGTLQVDCLNAILDALKAWIVPMIMIPGNHDQVTLGGDNHGLTPLANAYRVGDVPGPLILSHPTLFRSALFVPHLKDNDRLRRVLQSPTGDRAKALFLHAEIKGAMTNDQLVSTRGLAPSVLSQHKTVYSGHFHKPHRLSRGSNSNTIIEYPGSPYQISLAEAHQEKQLLVLDADWNCQQRIPISVGRKHFKLASPDELEHILVIHEDEAETSAALSTSTRLSKSALSALSASAASAAESSSPAIASTLQQPICVKKGDRIVMSLPKEYQREQELRKNALENDPPAWKSRVQSLREQGLMVEVREAPTSSSGSKETQEDPSNLPSTSDVLRFDEMSPESVWRAYLDDIKVRDSITGDLESLLQAGLEILEELEAESSSSFLSGGIQGRMAQKNLRLTSLSVSGFGPFEETIDYPLDNRGLVLLRGSNSDSGPDSNGTGKSSLAMATLWALTGSLDARPASDLKVADVVNDNSKAAKVTVNGFINDVPFVVTRTKTATKGDLTFMVNDVDLTTQSAKETQAVVEEKLGVNTHILTRVAFYGQHGRNDLLEATDARLKEELSMVVPLELWQQAASLARAKSRQARKKVDEIEGMVRLRKSDISTLSNKVAHAKQARDLQQRGLIQAEERLHRELERIQKLLEKTSNTNVEELQTQLEDVSVSIRTLTDLHESTMAEQESHMKPLEDELTEARELVSSVTRKSTRYEMDAHTAKVSLQAAKLRMHQVHEKWSIDASDGVPSVLEPPKYCPTCQQPLRSSGESEHVSEETLQNAQKAMEEEIHDAQEHFSRMEIAHKEASIKSSECLEALQTHEGILRELQSNHQKAASQWNAKFQTLQQDLRDKRQIQSTLTSQLSMVVQESQLFAAKESAKAAFATEQLRVEHANDRCQSLEEELQAAQEFLEELSGQQQAAMDRQNVWSSLGERFGPKGVQTFLLQTTVAALQATAQVYLSTLSHDSQRLELSLEAGDKIARRAFVMGFDGEFRSRPLSTLSGGQWRRCSLALSLAFAELVASTGRLQSSLLVLDEPLTHLDRSGRARFGALLRSLLQNSKRKEDHHQQQNQNHQQQHLQASTISTALVILQDLSAEELEEAFDGIDTVVRKDGKSRLQLDDMT